MKRTIFAIAIAALVLGGCLSTQKENSAQDSASQNAVGVPNPFYSFKSLADAEKAAGFDFYLLDVFEDCAIQVYRAIPKQMIEAIYDSESGDEIRIRKAPGKNDPSGDYNIYTEKSSQSVGGYEITFYANGNKCGKAVWNMGNYTCSITSRDRISLDKALKTAQKIIEMNAAR
ncbi:MAG: DUF4367 domain-containing protein [Treponema sp.]|nr:DUF4367 domain-containing protein [Treponema sp.]